MALLPTLCTGIRVQSLAVPLSAQQLLKSKMQVQKIVKQSSWAEKARSTIHV
jgi:hypothetical protein